MDQRTHKRILIVDDEEDVMTLIVSRLEASGFEVDFATNGSDALSLVKDGPPDLILLDVMMPEMNGFQVLEHLKAADSTKHIPVVMISAQGQQKDISKAETLGAVDYIIKPFTAPTLLERISRVCDAA